MPKKLKKQKKPKKLKLRMDIVVGYVLLLVGLILIVLAVCWMYSAFTSGSAPISVFRMENRISVVSGDERATIEGISGEDINRTVNLGLWSVVMFFLISGGSRIASLGVKMIRVKTIREVKVEVKEG